MGSPPLPAPIPLPTGVEDAKPPPLKVASHKSLGPPSSKLNAFTLLMRNAAKQTTIKSQHKGKGKAVSLYPKTSTTGVTDKKGKGKSEPEAKKLSLKDRMQRKKKQEPAVPTKFVPMIFDEDDEEQVESEEQSEAKAPEVVEPVIAAPEEKHPLLEVDIQKSQDSLPVVPGEQPTVEPSMTGEPGAKPLTESEITPESVPQPQPQPASPIPSSLETKFDLAGTNNTTSTEESISPTPAIPEVTVIQEHHNRANSPLLVVEPVAIIDDAIQAEVTTLAPIDEPTEPQGTEEPQLAPQITDVPVEQPAPPKPKYVPRKRGQSNIPTSTRVTRSTLRPPVAPVVTAAARREYRSSPIS